MIMTVGQLIKELNKYPMYYQVLITINDDTCKLSHVEDMKARFTCEDKGISSEYNVVVLTNNKE